MDQALAVVLTYGAIVSTYVPFVFEAWEEEELAGESQSLDSIGDEGVEEGEVISFNTPAGALEAEEGPLTPSDFFVGLVAFVLLVGMCPEVRGKRTAPFTPSSEYHIRRQPPRVREPRSDVGSRRCVVVESGQRR